MKFIFFAMMFAISSAFSQGIEIHSRLASGNLFGNEMQLHFRILNNSGAKLDLTKANLLYRFSNKSSLGGALYAKGGSLALENSIVSANKAGNGAAIYAENARLKIRHSTVAATAETPLFKSNAAAGEDGLFFTKDDGYALADNSPMIDKGAKQADIPLDIFQIDRTISKDGSGLPDMGAREWFPDLKKNLTFYRIAEENGLVEYRTYRNEDEGIYLFLSQREMPSYDWYHVLKVYEGGFHIEIEANK